MVYKFVDEANLRNSQKLISGFAKKIEEIYINTRILGGKATLAELNFINDQAIMGIPPGSFLGLA